MFWKKPLWLFMPLVLLALLFSCHQNDDDDDDVESNADLSISIEQQNTACNPINESACLYPWPSNVFTTASEDAATKLLVNVPVEIQPTSATGSYDPSAYELNGDDGFSTISSLLAHFPQGVDTSTIQNSRWGGAASVQADASIQIIEKGTGERWPYFAEVDLNAVDESGNADYNDQALIIRPLQAFNHAATYRVAITNSVKAADGGQLNPPDGFYAILNSIPTDNETIESLRDSYVSIFSDLEAAGLQRQNLILAWEFTTRSEDDAVGVLRSMVDLALQETVTAPTLTVVHPVEEGETSVVKVAWDELYQVLTAELLVPNFLTDKTELYRDSSGNVTINPDTPTRSVAIEIVIPTSVQEAGSALNLMSMGHGLFSSSQEVYNGGDGNTVSELLYVLHETQSIGVITNWSGISGDINEQLQILTAVGTDYTHLISVTANLAQSVVNQNFLIKAMMEIIKDDDLLAKAGTPYLDGDEAVKYHGHSAGAIMGIVHAALNSEIEQAAFGVAGGGWSHILLRSEAWNSPRFGITLKDEFAKQLPSYLDQHVVFNIWQQYFDMVDSVNYVNHLQNDPFTGNSAKPFHLQVAYEDTLVNMFTGEILARTASLTQALPAPQETYGLEKVELSNSTPVSGSLFTMYADERYTAGEQDDIGATTAGALTTEDGDDKIHNTVRRSTPYRQQVIEFFNTGAAKHYCDGVCDPE